MSKLLHVVKYERIESDTVRLHLSDGEVHDAPIRGDDVDRYPDYFEDEAFSAALDLAEEQGYNALIEPDGTYWEHSDHSGHEGPSTPSWQPTIDNKSSL